MLRLFTIFVSMNNSRTDKIVRNGSYALVFHVANIVLGIVSRRVFIEHLGADLQGLNAMVGNILSVLSIAELGIGAAMASVLYKPLADGDRRSVAELVALQGWLYRWVAVAVAAASAVILLFFPKIFAGASLPMWYSVATYLVLLASALCGYLLNYKQIVLSADQQEHKVTLADRGPGVVRTLLQILAIAYTDHGYEWWLAINLMSTVATSLLLKRMVSASYSYLDVPISLGASLRKKYPEVARRVRLVFCHKLAALALLNVSPIFIYKYVNLTVVSIHSNYMMILLGVTLLESALARALQSSVGNLVATSSRDEVVCAASQLTALWVSCSSLCAFAFVALSAPFAVLWVGEGMTLGLADTSLMALTMLISMSRSVVDALISAYGYFADVWASVAEAALNVALSMLLGSQWGLTGVLAGVALSQLLMVSLWKPLYLFRVRMRLGLWQGVGRYLALSSLCVAAAVGVGCLTVSIMSWFGVSPYGGVLHFVGYSAVAVALFSAIYFPLLFVVSPSMRGAVVRVARWVKGRFRA